MPITKNVETGNLVIESGVGDVSLGMGDYGGVPALAVFNAGPGGIVGEPHPRQSAGSDPVLVVTFPTVEVVEVWVRRLTELLLTLQCTRGHNS